MTDMYTKTAITLLLTGLAIQPALAETFEHGSITVAPPATSSPTPTPQPPVAISAPSVSRSTFTTAISGREPVDQLSHISAGQQVYYFTELNGLQGHVITHKWERDGAFQLGLQFPVGGSPWRVNSSKNITPNLAGSWTVTVQNDDGSILKQETLVVDPVIPAPAQPLTQIPPDMQKTPAPRPDLATPPLAETPPANPEPAKPEAMPETAPVEEQPATGKPIWETLPR